MQPNIQYTTETEQDFKLPFLDVLVEKTEVGILKTSVFRKPMAALRVLPYNSSHSHSIKIGIVKNLVNRAVNLSSDEKMLTNELEIIRQLCVEGGYPEKVVNKIVKLGTNEKTTQQNKKGGEK